MIPKELLNSIKNREESYHDGFNATEASNFAKLHGNITVSSDDGHSASENSGISDGRGDTNTDTDDEEPDIDLDPRYLNSKYECLRPTPLIPPYNKKLVSLLETIERARELSLESKNALSYRHAIAAIKSYPREIQSSREAAKIKGIGTKIAGSIKTFLETGTIPEADAIREDERYQTLEIFNGIFGVGPVTAKAWYNKGYRTIDDILENEPDLSVAQRLGIELYKDFSQRMSRADVEEILNIVTMEVKAIDPRCELTPVGGYRRGKTSNGDLDVVISHPDEESAKELLRKIVHRLEKKGHLKHQLWYGEPSQYDEAKRDILVGNDEHKNVMDKLDKCFCAFLQPSTGIHRQLDIIVAPWSQYGTAVLGWSGSRQFERAMKDFAKKEHSRHFASHGLFTNTIPRQRIPVRDERHCFELMGLKWIDPEFRNC
ncbi:hypothetical protein BZG36_00498 [Bifiguratus adelaidae]|uniref:DNA-directed DNA polymerase n=1 Tax=Bifiguratus adelaidae TaxID=1938954 RepID=A0A261Y794_9FUNG|nr:hypothetical protein BZG36_00498 [Bifiguratus adelaidae]